MRSNDLFGLRLPKRSFGSRFSTDDVDSFVNECRQALHSWERGIPASLRAADVIQRTFRGAGLFTAGYETDAVDLLLDEVTAQLRTHEPEVDEGPSAEETLLRETLEVLKERLRNAEPPK